MQHAVGFVDSEAETLEEWNVANQHAKADRQKQEGFVFFGYGEIEKK